MIISIWIHFPGGQYVTPTANLWLLEGAEKKSRESLRLCLLSRYISENLCLSFSYIMRVTYLFVVQSLSHVWLFATPCTAACQSSLSFTISQSLLKVTSIELVMPSNHLIFCRLLLSCPQSFPKSRSFPMSQLFASSGQSIGVLASTSVLPMNIQGWFPLGLSDLISLQSKELSRVFSSITIQKHQFFGAPPS